MNDSSFLLDFRHFVGLQLVSFNIRQGSNWSLLEICLQNFPIICMYCNFFPALVFFSNDFLPFNVILLLMSFL